MKVRILSVAAIIAAVCGQSILGQNLKDGLVAYYPLQADGRDASGNGNDGVPHNVSPATNRFGQPAQALYFNTNGGSYIDCSSPQILQFSGDFTVSAWANFSGGTINPRIISYPDLRGYQLFTDGTESNRKFVFGYAGSFTESPTTYPADTWHFVAIERWGTNLLLFVNGEFVATNEVIFNPNYFKGADLNIGRKATDDFDSWGGAINEVRFYNRALSNDELKMLYTPPVY
jgi:hypothetical protein